MSGYTPLFNSLTRGTLCGRWPDIGLWPIVLSLSDRKGVVDVHPNAIAGLTGLQVEEVIACMSRFCEPDPMSRSQDCDGRRLVLLDEHRDWGWQIVNHGKYREKARKAAYDAARTASGQDAERKRASRDVPRSPAKSRSTNTNINNTPPTPPAGGDDSGFDQFWEAYPRKIRKAAAKRVWSRKRLNAISGEIVSHLKARVRRDAQWLADGGKYIPHPATWLNGDGWQDEYERRSEDEFVC